MVSPPRLRVLLLLLLSALSSLSPLLVSAQKVDDKVGPYDESDVYNPNVGPTKYKRGQSFYARFVDPGTDPLWLRILFWSLLVFSLVAYLMDCYFSGKFVWILGRDNEKIRSLCEFLKIIPQRSEDEKRKDRKRADQRGRVPRMLRVAETWKKSKLKAKSGLRLVLESDERNKERIERDDLEANADIKANHQKALDSSDKSQSQSCEDQGSGGDSVEDLKRETVSDMKKDSGDGAKADGNEDAGPRKRGQKDVNVD